MKTFIDLFKSEAVLIISLLLAIISAFIITPNAGYIDYIDFRTLALLFCLMVAMEGFKRLGVFSVLAEKLLARVNSARALCLTLSLLCFFSSMIITNDVALITFVPFTIIVLKLTQQTDKMIYIVVLETIAANLGSMLTPIGNPQNLYLFSNCNMSISDFLSTILPYALLSLILIIISSFFIKQESVQICDVPDEVSDKNAKLFILYTVLFILALFSVFRVLHYLIMLGAALVLIIIFDRNIIKQVDYSLLGTFVALFIFVGNLGNIDAISNYLHSFVSGNEVIASILASQVFSNVPAAILLSGFTDNAKELLIGVNLGGLGTLIASMASLISFKFIQREKIQIVKYLGIFTVFNIIFLLANLTLWYII